jgi:hypothetical protein
VLLNKLESGLLLFQTQQGLVAVEPSFWQRVYLLWTFRNFRQLSLPLLNPRQTELINNLFRQHAAVVSHEYEPSLEIGVVQDFVPPAIDFDAALDTKTDAAPTATANLSEQSAEQDIAPADFPIAAAPAMMADVPPALEMEDTENQDIAIDRPEFAPAKALDRSFAPIISWPVVPWLKRASSHLQASTPEAPRPQMSRSVIFGFATAVGALSLCVYFTIAFHGIGAAPGPQPHSSPPQLSSPDSPSAPEPTPVAENPAPTPDAPSQAGDVPDAAVDPAPPPVPSPKVQSSTSATHSMTTPERASRGPVAHVASRSTGGLRAPAFSKVRGATSNRRMTSAPASRGPKSHSAQSYFDLANRQMHQGLYAAAAANYKLAWRIEDKNAAARGHLLRARRTMQPQNESIANR